MSKLKLKDIRIDGDTQPRARIDEHVVAEYAEEMAAGHKFPPLVVFVFEGTHWLVDGYHRYFAALKAGLTEFACEAQRGTQAEAQWASYGVNRSHGLRRTRDDKRRAVEMALRHPRSKLLSNTDIANHVGVSEFLVRTIREEKGEQSPSTRGRNPNSIQSNSGGQVLEPQGFQIPCQTGNKSDSDADDDIPMGDEPETPPSPAPAKKSFPVDQVGNPIASPEIAKAFERRQEITGMMTTISDLKNTLLRMVEDRDPLAADLNPSDWKATCENVHRQLRAIRPYAVCPYCRGKGCRACHARGFVGEFSYNAAPSEMKKGGKKR